MQSTRMILKFRTEAITKLERTIKKNGLIEEDAKDKEIVRLKYIFDVILQHLRDKLWKKPTVVILEITLQVLHKNKRYPL